MYRAGDNREFKDVIIMKRQRGRNRNNNRNNNHNNHNRALDSNGPEVKVRGTASTIYEKYTTLARDAQSSGNRVKAENLRQHAEHYLRVMNIQEAAKRAAQEERDAARAARGETGQDSDTDDKKPKKQSRRHQHRDKADAPKGESPKGDSEKAEQGKNSSDKALDVVTPDADNDSVTSVSADDKPKRRRKAPARKPEAEIGDEAVDAAE